MGRNCKTCKRGITAQEKTYFRVSCNTHTHLTTECTAHSPAAMNGITELGKNAMLLFTTCAENKERDNFIRGRALASVSEKLESLDIGEKLKNMEKRLTDLVKSKNGDTRTTNCDKVEKTYAAVFAVDKTTSVKPKKSQNAEAQKSNHNIKYVSYNVSNTYNINIIQIFRIQGLKEGPSKSKAKNFVPTNIELNEMLFTIGAKPHVLEFAKTWQIEPRAKET